VFYSELTSDQIAAAYILFRLLEKLRIIGHIQVRTERVDRENGDIFGHFSLYNFAHTYNMIKDGYTSEPRSLDAIEELERVLNREFRRANPLCP
jgi:hypothetical protein